MPLKALASNNASNEREETGEDPGSVLPPLRRGAGGEGEGGPGSSAGVAVAPLTSGEAS